MRAFAGLALLLLSGCDCGGPTALAKSTFTRDDEGWTLTGDVDQRPELRASGGNPGGTICGTDQVGGNIWYFVAPGYYLGDVSRAWGLRLTFDLKQDTIFNQIRGRDVVLNGSGLSVVYNLRQTPGVDWTPYSVALDVTGGWLRDEPGFPAATEADLRTVFRNLTSLRIRGEYVDGSDSACLDNVYFGTP